LNIQSASFRQKEKNVIIVSGSKAMRFIILSACSAEDGIKLTTHEFKKFFLLKV